MEKNSSFLKLQILKFIEKMEISKRGFYSITKMANGTLDKPTGVSEENIFKFLNAFPDVRLEWFFYDEEPVLKSEYRNISPDFNSLMVAEPTADCQKLPLEERMNYLQNQMIMLGKSYRGDISIINNDLDRLESKIDKVKSAQSNSKEQRSTGE